MNLTWRIALIVILVALAAVTLYPPQKKLKPGIDLAGGTSLIYEIDTKGLESEKRENIAQKMITVLRMRVDPANIRNLIWRALGDTRFEIQMPLASSEARQARKNYEQAKLKLLKQNINTATILRSLEKPPQKRKEDFKKFARGSEERLNILNQLAQAYDQRTKLQRKRDELHQQLKNIEQNLKQNNINIDAVKDQRSKWAKLDEQKLQNALAEFVEEKDNIDELENYVKTYHDWAQVVDKLTAEETGKNIRFRQAQRALYELNLSEEQLESILARPQDSPKRKEQIENLKTEFPDRADLIEKVVKAYDQYRPHRGRLDDPKDLQRMLKGAGILEFRILPTRGHPKVDNDRMNAYLQTLKAKGPKYASDENYIWCQIENPRDWIIKDEGGNPIIAQRDGEERPAIIGQFADKFYVLTSNKPEETMLHQTGKKSWRLEEAFPRRDPQSGTRAIGFILNARAAGPFSSLTGNNKGRPLCIILDDLAISAPNIRDQIRTEGIITGNFTQNERQDMINKLNAGSLPARLIEQPISVKTIGPSIGADNRDKGITAGFIGLCLVVVCMLIYYMLAGGIADTALIMNILFVLGMMALLNATFTLPGIAGIILTIGMSVDANVLIFERIREEQEKGNALRVAIRNGYDRAFRAIFDANLTTFITAAILFWRASEEIKGFAIVLMLGIASSLFTALFVTRVIFELLLAKGLIKNKLFMLRLIHQPKINWMRLKPAFFAFSAIFIAAGLYVFFTRNDQANNKYDIEFTGGTKVTINLKPGFEMTRQEVADKIHEVGSNLNNPAIASANVYKVGQSQKTYEINTTATNQTSVTINLQDTNSLTNQQIISDLKKAQEKTRGKLTNLRVEQNPDYANSFTIYTSQINKSVIKEIAKKAFPKADIAEPEVNEVVNDAIRKAFSGMLQIQENLQPTITSTDTVTEEVVQSYPELADYLGGVKIQCKIKKSASAKEIDQRLKDLLFKPGLRNLNWNPYEILNSNLEKPDPNVPLSSYVYVSAKPEAGLQEIEKEKMQQFIEEEKGKILNAASLETSLPRVTQFDPSVGAEAKTRALIAIVLALFAIIAYIWVRFGNLRYGLAAILALVHDVCITLGAVVACTYIAGTSIGQTLLIGDFKIDLAMIAAFLTIIGYSLNDTIVVFDRIRENRRKGVLRAKIINDSINQILSRTIMTSFTTFIVVLVMYIWGGQGLRGFCFAIGLGIIVGTYSSIAVAAPAILFGRENQQAKA